MGIWDVYNEKTQSIHLMGANLTTLEGMPQNLPDLELLDIRNNHLENFVGLPASLPQIHKIHLDNNPLRSLHGVSLALLPDVLKAIIRSHNGITAFNFSEATSTHISEVISFQEESFSVSIYHIQRLNALYDYFKESPYEIALQLINTHSLTPDQTERLQHEGGFRERELLEKHLPQDNEIIKAIIQNLSLKTRLAFNLLK